MITFVENFTKMTEELSIDKTKEFYEKLTKGFSPSPFITTDWKMENGIYIQYSAYDNNTSYPSGTGSSVVSISL